MNFDATGNYWPTLFFNEFWLMREHLFPINETTPELPLKMSYSTLSLWRWQMMIQMQQSLQMQESLGASVEFPGFPPAVGSFTPNTKQESDALIEMKKRSVLAGISMGTLKFHGNESHYGRAGRLSGTPC